MGNPKYANGFRLTLHEDALDLPLRWRKPRAIFVNSMSDLFHEDVPDEFVHRVFAVMARGALAPLPGADEAARAAARARPRTWHGSRTSGWASASRTSATSPRIDLLRQTRAHVKFLSIEPLLGPLPALDLAGIDWAIVGGESGPGAARWRRRGCATSATSACDAGVPFFFKQWGGVQEAPHRPRAGGPHLGRDARAS